MNINEQHEIREIITLSFTIRIQESRSTLTTQAPLILAYYSTHTKPDTTKFICHSLFMCRCSVMANYIEHIDKDLKITSQLD